MLSWQVSCVTSPGKILRMMPMNWAIKPLGWGLNLSSNLNFTKSTVGRFQVVYGEGIQNYMNDAPADIGIKNNFSDPDQPILVFPCLYLGIVAFVDQQWNDKFSSSVGYSMVDIDNSDGQIFCCIQKGTLCSGQPALLSG